MQPRIILSLSALALVISLFVVLGGFRPADRPEALAQVLRTAQVAREQGIVPFRVTIGDAPVKGLRGIEPFVSENEVVEYKAATKDGGYAVQKIPGRLKTSALVLKVDPGEEMLWTLRRAVVDGKVASVRKNMRLEVLRDNAPIEAYVFTNAWVSKWTGPHQEAGGAPFEEVAIEFDSIERQR